MRPSSSPVTAFRVHPAIILDSQLCMELSKGSSTPGTAQEVKVE
jgi:hypothetical protein